MALLSGTDLLNALAAVDALAASFPQGVGDPVVVQAMWSRDYSEAMDIEGHQPTLLCRTTDVSGVSHGATVTVSSVDYTVRSIQPRDDGLTRLVLEEDET